MTTVIVTMAMTTTTVTLMITSLTTCVLHNDQSCALCRSLTRREKKQLSTVWTREQDEELAELFYRYKNEDGE